MEILSFLSERHSNIRSAEGLLLKKQQVSSGPRRPKKHFGHPQSHLRVCSITVSIFIVQNTKSTVNGTNYRRKKKIKSCETD